MTLPFRFKEGMHSADHVHPLLWVYINQIGKWHQEQTGYRMVVTSMIRWNGKASYHNPDHAKDKHKFFRYLSTAFDMRRWYMTFPQLEKFCLDVKRSLDIGCLIEPEWMSAKQIAARGGIQNIAPHVHWQLSSRNLLWLDELGQLRQPPA